MSKRKHTPDDVAKPKAEYKKITVRLTSAQLETLNERAESFGYKSLSKYLVERGLKEGEMIASVNREHIERLLFEVRKVGVNINQIAREMHRGYSDYSQAYLDRTMQAAEQVIGEIHQTLGEDLAGGHQKP
jgi:hypothetical protein